MGGYYAGAGAEVGRAITNSFMKSNIKFQSCSCGSYHVGFLRGGYFMVDLKEKTIELTKHLNSEKIIELNEFEQSGI